MNSIIEYKTGLKMKNIITLLFVGILLFQMNVLNAQNNNNELFVPPQKEVYPNKLDSKLIIGIVVDQMRYDYLVRFYNKFGNGGFKKLIRDGYNLENVNYNYIPTYTAVGHASIYTGTTPFYHGIISNDWYDKFEKQSIYCVDDDNYKSVGLKDNSGGKSPSRMLTTTITDQLRLSQNMRGKTIGIAIKDRSAVLPAGHTANAAYWFEGGKEGKFISSTFYMNDLPKWVVDFNSSGKANAYLNEVWDTYYDIDTYRESLPDNNPYEGLFTGKLEPVFPYKLSELRKLNGNYNLLKAVPAGNSITTDFAKAAILGENLGKGNEVDFLTVSYSSTDYIGHQFGVNAVELEDTYIRLDKELESFLQFLDDQVGKDNYTLFLTADHAAIPVPAYLNDVKIPGGYFDAKAFKKFVNDIALERFKSNDLIEDISNYQIFLNKEKIKELKLNVIEVSQIIADEILNFNNVYKSITAHTLQTASFNAGLMQIIQNGYNQKISGDIIFVLNPSTITYSNTGSTHGSGFTYDTHVPLLFYGNGIKKGSSNNPYLIIDIAPTLANFLKISPTNGNSGSPILELF